MVPKPVNAAEVLRVLAVFERCDLSGEDLTWRVKGEDEADIGVICNDVFYWGTADVEDVLPGDFDLLDQCATDLLALDAEYHLAELFAARKRKMRPQTPWGRIRRSDGKLTLIDNLDPRVRALFDAAGPPRDRKDEG